MASRVILILSPLEELAFGMSMENSGCILRKLNHRLREFMRKRKRFMRKGSYGLEIDFKVMFLIETIVHFSTMIFTNPRCILQVSLREIQRCRMFVSHIRDYSSDGNGLEARKCLILLQDLKKRGLHVSMLLS